MGDDVGISVVAEVVGAWVGLEEGELHCTLILKSSIPMILSDSSAGS